MSSVQTDFSEYVEPDNEYWGPGEGRYAVEELAHWILQQPLKGEEQCEVRKFSVQTFFRGEECVCASGKPGTLKVDCNTCRQHIRRDPCNHLECIHSVNWLDCRDPECPGPTTVDPNIVRYCVDRYFGIGDACQGPCRVCAGPICHIPLTEEELRDMFGVKK